MNIQRQGRKALTPKEFAESYGIPEKTLADWRLKRIGPPYVSISRRKVIYPMEGIDAWVAANICLTTDCDWRPDSTSRQ